MCIDLLGPQNAKKKPKRIFKFLNFPPKLALESSETWPHWVNRIADGIKTLNLVRRWIFLDTRTGGMAIWNFFTIPDLIRKKIRIAIIILISFHFYYFYNDEASNCHNSGSSWPKTSIRGPNSRSWCQLSNGTYDVMFLTILTLVLAGYSTIRKCVFFFFILLV